MPAWWNHVFEVISRGLHPAKLPVLQTILIGCSILALIPLVTLWGTRWGDRNSVFKSFFLSLFVHVCLVLCWASFAEYQRATLTEVLQAATTEDAPTATQVQVVWDASESLESSPSALTGEWQRTLVRPTESSARERQDRSTGTWDEIHSTPSPNEPIAVPLPADFDLSMTDTGSDSDPPVLGQPESSPTPTPAPNNPPLLTDADRELPARAEAISTPVRARRGPAPTRPASTETATDVSRRTEPRNSAPTPDPLPLTLPMSDGNTAALKPRVPSISVVRTPAAVTPKDIKLPPDTMVLRGVVRDHQSGRPLPQVTIQVDRRQGRPLTATTAADGSYEIRLSDVPDQFALTATRDGYTPESRNVRRPSDGTRPSQLDFTIHTARSSTITVEDTPTVRHLGNDRFEGRINSQFQRKAEGTSVSLKFTLHPDQLRSSAMRPAVVFFAKGIQCWPEVQINEHVLEQPSTLSPVDGGFGKITLPCDRKNLKSGENVVTIKAADCNGDLDDFEFVNLQLKLSQTDE